MSGWVAGAIVVGAVGGALISADASKKAANKQAKSIENANQLQWEQYLQNREDLAPWREAGAGAVGQLRELTAPGGEFSKPFQMGEWTTDPGYQFRLAEGMKALERSGSARGMSLSGAQMKAFDRYNQDFASNEYSNVYNRTYNQFANERSNRFNQLAALAGIGQTSAGQLAVLGSQTTGQMGQNLVNLGNAQAASGIAQANAWTGALNTGVNQWMNYRAMQPQASAIGGMYGGGGASGTYNPAPGNPYGFQGDLNTGLKGL
jgi:hypothetical protein